MTDHHGATRLGRPLEDFVPGDVFYHWPGKTVTAWENQLATFMTVNPSSIHFDAVSASDAGHPDMLVNGGLVLMIVHGLTVADVSSAPAAIAHLGFDDVRIENPTYPGDTLYAMSQVLKTRPSRSKPDRGIVTVRTIGFNQKKQRVITFDRNVMVYRRDAVPAIEPLVTWKELAREP